MDARNIVNGKVVSVNSHGFRLDGYQEWFNISKFAHPAPSLPTNGQTVAVLLDKAGFVRKVDPLLYEVQPAPVAKPEPQPAPAPEPMQPTEAPTRDTVISRLAVLNTATAILSSGNRSTSAADVLAVAAQLEAWANRPA